MTTNIVETLPWIDYGEVFKKIEERGRAEGRAEVRAERDAEIVQKLFGLQEQGANLSELIQTFKDLGISDEIIESVRRQREA